MYSIGASCSGAKKAVSTMAPSLRWARREVKYARRIGDKHAVSA